MKASCLSRIGSVSGAQDYEARSLEMQSRVEYKYFVPAPVKSRLLYDIQKFTLLDSFSDNTYKSYRVVSLYFESRDFKSYFDKIEGQAKKFKVRVRYYPDHGDSGNANLEIKYKIFDRCYKEKLNIAHSDLMKLGTSSIADFESLSSSQTLENFIILKKRYHLAPLLRIDYRRRAMRGFSDAHLRVTYDSEVNCIRLVGQDVLKSNIPVVPGELGVLEVKSPGYYPWWLSKIIKKYSLSRRAISKYGLGIQSMAVNSTLNFT